MKTTIQKLFLIVVFSLSSSIAQASFISNLVEEVRPTMMKFLGKETTLKLIGHAPNTIELPEIPKIKQNARSTAGLHTKPKNNVSYNKEQAQRFDFIFVKEMTRAVRETVAGEDELARWMNVFSQGGSREGVYNALVLDSTYTGLENLDRMPTDAVLDFTLSYLDTYLNKSIDKKTLANVNFYRVKREIAERTLLVVDELFQMNGPEIYHWYAVFSADMAKRFPEVMNNDVRKVEEEIKHKIWAQSVPDQFIKSEILIKLHRIFNFLQGQADSL